MRADGEANIATRYDGPPMDLANMRKLGVREVYLDCACGRSLSVIVDHLPNSAAVPEIRNLYRCSACGARPVMSRPDRKNYRPPGSGTL